MSTDPADEIRKRMALIRGELRSEVQTLVQNAKVKTDWRHYVKRYLWLSFGAVALAGIWLVPKAIKKTAFDPEWMKSAAVSAVATANGEKQVVARDGRRQRVAVSLANRGEQADVPFSGSREGRRARFSVSRAK